jgi:hypothetical protein
MVLTGFGMIQARFFIALVSRQHFFWLIRPFCFAGLIFRFYPFAQSAEKAIGRQTPSGAGNRTFQKHKKTGRSRKIICFAISKLSYYTRLF